MQQKVILHSEQISRRGEIKYFQIPLEGTAIKIIGVEVSAFLFTRTENTNASQISMTSASSLIGDIIDENGSGGAAGSGGATTSSYDSCPNPGQAFIDIVSDTVANNIRTQVFRIGAAVNPTFQYSCGVYSHSIRVTAVNGDTPETIAAKMATEVNNTSLAAWSQYGSNNTNYKPTAVANGDSLSLTTDSQHAFFASGVGECAAAPPPPPPPPTPPQPQLLEYDPLFRIVQNERAGVLSLQSPDATDIFMQCDAWRKDGNTGFGDHTFAGEESCEWLRGRKRLASEVNITTASPILEAYYKDSWGVYHNKDLNYGLNIFIWFEKVAA